MPELAEESGSPAEQVDTDIDWAEALTQSRDSADDTEDSTADVVEEPLQAEGTESTDVEASEAETETDTETDQDSDSPEPLEPLEQWSEEHKEVFSKLDIDAQKFLLDRHSEMDAGFTRKTQELSEERKHYESISQVLKPYEEVLAQTGQPVAPVVAQAMNLLATVSRDPAEAVKQAIQAYNLTPEQIGLAEEDDLTDPTIKALRQEVADLKRAQTQQAQSSDIEKQREGQAQIEAFKNAKDDKGDPKYPYFDRLRSRMAPLVQDGSTLEEAYNEVVYTIPEYRESLLKSERDKIEKEMREKAEAERKRKAKESKKATTLPQSDVDAIPTKGPMKNWEGALKETLSQMQ